MELVDNDAKIEEMRERARELVGQMTLEEKVYQTLNSAPAIERLNIKGYDWWNEALHGVARAGTATVFPQAIGLAATFDEDMLEKVADAISTEGRAKYNMQQSFSDVGRYKGITFWAPNINIFRDPRWGRGHETYGEDPYLTSRLGIRFIQGLQGHNEKYLKTAACVKHMAVHSGPEGLRHEFNAVVSMKDLYETYLPAFKACIQEAKVEAVMGAYNRVNGEPCCGSKTLLLDILRDKWNFKGHVVSDCFAIRDFHEHHRVTATPTESAAMAMNNGCDLNCGSIFMYLKEAVENGMVSKERLDEAVVNIYTTKMKLGTFDDADNDYNQIPYSVVDSLPMKKLNREAAQKSIVLLKNADNILPLDLKKIKNIGVIGPNSNSRRALVGNYEGTASRYVTVAEGIQDYVGDSARVFQSDGCHLYKDIWKKDMTTEVRAICEESDVIIACMGLDADIEGEQGDAGNDFASGDKKNLELPGLQQKILEVAYDSGKPVILVLLAGSALAVTWADEYVNAIVQGWYPGADGGAAIADVLFGDKNPEGRLPVTFYRTTEELPDFTDYSMQGRTYRYMKCQALYPFGYGLSYTDYEYSNLQVSSELVERTGVNVSVDVKNTGAVTGNETVQIYVRADKEGAPNFQLKGLKKVTLNAGETKTITMHLDSEAFNMINEEGEEYLYNGDYYVYAGGSQPDDRSYELLNRKPLSKRVKCVQ